MSFTRHIASITLGLCISLACVAPAVAASNLTVFDWAGYEEPQFFQDYMEAYGEAPDYAYFSGEAAAFAKVRTGFQPDLAHPCLATLSLWRRAGLIEPIDVSRIKHWSNVIPTIRDLVTINGKVWMLPFEWGNTGLIYLTDKVPGKDVGIDLFVNPEYKGRVSLPTATYDAYALAFLATGLDDWNDVTDEQFKKATQWLRRAHENVRFYWSSPGQLAQAMASGEIVAAWTWNQAWATLNAEGYPVAMLRGPDAKSSSWVCGYVDLKNSGADDEEVYDFLNALLAPESGKYMIEAWGYAHANKKSFEVASPQAIKSAGLNNFNKLIKGSFFQTSPAPKLKAKMEREFARIKAGF